MSPITPRSGPDPAPIRRGSQNVMRTALQNAASIAGLMLTTEAMVSEIPEPKVAAPAGGGMEGM